VSHRFACSLLLSSTLACLPRSAELSEYSSEWSPLRAPGGAGGVPSYAGAPSVGSNGGTTDAGTLQTAGEGGTEETPSIPLDPAGSGGSSAAEPEETSGAAATPPGGETCEDGVTGPDQHTCYQASTVLANWQDAQQACTEWGGALVKVESAAEDQFLGDLVELAPWLGASDVVAENVFAWTDGSPITFGNWGPGQPDAFPGQDCVEKRQSQGGLWYDQPCNNPHVYVCEKPLD
jgi:hypothetical protein